MKLWIGIVIGWVTLWLFSKWWLFNHPNDWKEFKKRFNRYRSKPDRKRF